jgi:hypothetical protein
LSNNSSIVLQLEAQATNSTLSEAQANSTSSGAPVDCTLSEAQANSTSSGAQVDCTLSEAQANSTSSEAQVDSTQSEAQEANNPSLQQSSPDKNYYFVLEPEQDASVVNY